MNKIYLVRHCEPCSRDYDDTERRLTEKGYKDTEKVKKFFDGKNVDLIFSSPYTRALETILPFSKDSNLEIIKVEDFRERKIGKTLDNFDEFSKRQWEDFDFKFDNGDSLREVQNRNIRALKEVLSKNYNKNIVISGHGTAISTIVNFYDSEFNFEKFYELKDVMPFVVEMEFDGKEFKNYTIYNF